MKKVLTKVLKNNFRLNTKLLSDANILSKNKPLLINSFPTYNLPIEIVSRKKKKKNLKDCPPVDCPPCDEELQGQSSRWKPKNATSHYKEIDSDEIFGNTELDNSDYIDEDFNNKKLNLPNYSGRSACEFVDKKTLFKQMQEQFKNNGIGKAGELFQDQFTYQDINTVISLAQRKIETKSSEKTWHDVYLRGYEKISKYTYTPLISKVINKNPKGLYRYVLYTNCDNFIIQKIKHKEKIEYTYPLPINKYFKILNLKNSTTEDNVFDFKPKKITKANTNFSEKKIDLVLLANEFYKRIGEEKFDNKKLETIFKLIYPNKNSSYFLKEIQEAFEFAMVNYCNFIFENIHIPSKENKFKKILDAYNNQATLNVRTSDSVQRQAYSTAAPLAALISMTLDLKNAESIYEPCSGNGMLLIGSDKSKVIANELDTQRAKALELQGINVIQGNALEVNPEKNFARIVMNPPFGSYNPKIKINGTPVSNIDHAIAITSLKFLEKNGLAGIILGGHNLSKDRFGGYKATDMFFTQYIYKNYDVIYNIDINGDLYRKQGTSFDIRLIILRNSVTDNYKHILPYQYGNQPGQIQKANTWEELYDILLNTTSHNDNDEAEKISRKISSINDIPKLVRDFMPMHQQKAIVGTTELKEVLERIKNQILNTPKTYETDDIPDSDKIIHLHYFYGSSDWYIAEKDKEKEQLQAYGYTVLNGDLENSDWGYINLEELKNTNKVELDFYWKPIQFKDLKINNKEEEYEQTKTTRKNFTSEISGMDTERDSPRGTEGYERHSRGNRNARTRISSEQEYDSNGRDSNDSKKLTQGDNYESEYKGHSEIGLSIGDIDTNSVQNIDPQKMALLEEFFKRFG